jgi:hypothetical protein
MIFSILLDQLLISTSRTPLLLPEKPHPINFRKFALTRHASLPPNSTLIFPAAEANLGMRGSDALAVPLAPDLHVTEAYLGVLCCLSRGRGACGTWRMITEMEAGRE